MASSSTPSISESSRSRHTNSSSASQLTKEDTRIGRFPIKVRDRRSYHGSDQDKRLSASLSPSLQTPLMEKNGFDLSTAGNTNSSKFYTISAPSERSSAQSSSTSLRPSSLSRPVSREEFPDINQPQQPPAPSFTYKTSTFSRIRRSDTSLPASESTPALLVPDKGLDSRRASSPSGKFRGIFRGKRSNSSLGSSASESNGTLPEEQTGTVEPSPLVPSQPSEKIVKVPETPEPAQKRPVPVRINTGPSPTPPKTPPSSNEPPAPLIVNTPPTPTNPQFERASQSPIKTIFSSPSSVVQEHLADCSVQPPPPPPTSRPASSGIEQGHRRLRSGSAGPSKLSNIILPPLSPTLEVAAANAQLQLDTVDTTIGHSSDLPQRPATSANAATGFFSSMISAAQNAATSIGTTITNNNPNANKSKIRSVSLSTTATSSTPLVDSSVSVEQPTPATLLPTAMDRKEPAVKTLGAGDLSLSQLGLAEPKMASSPNILQPPSDLTLDSQRGRSESSTSEALRPSEAHIDDHARSIYDHQPGDASPNHSVYGDVTSGGNGLQHNGSIRSALERHRKRGGSAATGGTIGAVIAAVNQSSLPLHAGLNTSVPKLTGFAIASKKRNKDFHALFKSVPDDDYLIEDYSCAVQREILAQGRLYVSEGHLCFMANILGWVTTLVIRFDEIITVEKRNTALIFKNGLMVSTLQNKHVFASFTSRDATYDLIINIWKLSHPSLKISADKTEKAVDDSSISMQIDDNSSGSEEESEDEDDVYDEDDDDNEVELEAAPITSASAPEPDSEKAAVRKPSATGGPNGVPGGDAAPPGVTGAQDFPGPATHPATDCGDVAAHYDRGVADDVISAPLGKVFDLIFGQASVNFIQKFIVEGQKCLEYTTDDKKGLSQDNKTRTCSYIKPLYGSIGPKQTKCIVTELIDNLDFNKAINVTVSTQTPDVPSGNLFVVKAHYCLSWAENNQTRMQVNCTVEWSGKSWIKGPIEKGANDGQLQYCTDLLAAIRGAISTRPRAGTGNGPTTKSKKKSRKGASAGSSPTTATIVKEHHSSSWGPLEAIRPILEPAVDIISPMLTGNIIAGLIIGLLLATWFRRSSPPVSANNATPFGGNSPVHFSFHTYPDRIAAYEEMWRREESQLWEWLEERVNIGRMAAESVGAAAGSGSPGMRRKPIEPRTMEERLREEKMDETEIHEAIQVTQRKLDVLKEVMRKKADAKAREAKDDPAQSQSQVAQD